MKFPQIYDSDKNGQATGKPRDMTLREKAGHVFVERIAFPVAAPFVMLAGLIRGENGPDMAP
jgi:hypothetical protein